MRKQSAEKKKWLAIRKGTGRKIDPETAEVSRTYRYTIDPYDVDLELPEAVKLEGSTSLGPTEATYGFRFALYRPLPSMPCGKTMPCGKNSIKNKAQRCPGARTTRLSSEATIFWVHSDGNTPLASRRAVVTFI